jgi:hypothetical protein
VDNVTYRFTPQGGNELILAKRLDLSGNR